MKVKIWIRTDKVGSKVEVTRDFEDWAEMTEEDREEACKQIAFNHCEWNYEEAV